MVGSEASQLVKALSGVDPPQGVQPVEHARALRECALGRDDLGDVARLAEQAEMVFRLAAVEDYTNAPRLTALMDSAVSVLGGLQKYRQWHMALSLSEERGKALATQEPTLSVDQRIALSGHDIERQRIQLDSELAVLQAVISFASLAIKNLMLLNGGAAVAILAFVGHLVANEQQGLASEFSGALTLFGVGALLGGVVSGLSYLAQVAFHAATNSHWIGKLGEPLRISAILCAISGYTVFGVGLWRAASVTLAS
jgi:hypothetical protein